MKNKALPSLLILFPVTVQIPFGILATRFGYPDILREDAGTVLTQFYQLGGGLIWAWYAYGISILLFLVGNLFLSHLFSKHVYRGLLVLGTVSGVVQLMALLRWVFLVPVLAQAYAVSSDPTAQFTIKTLFALQNSYLGIGLGEHLGQFTMACWTILLSLNIIKKLKFIRGLGLLSGTLLLFGLSEHLLTVFQKTVPQLDKIAALGFVLWSLWLMGLGIKLAKETIAAEIFVGVKND